MSNKAKKIFVSALAILLAGLMVAGSVAVIISAL